MVIDLETLRNEIIGNNTFFNTPFGKRIITYADYTASGKTLRFIENYLQKVQECYANTHTIDSFSGKTMTGIVQKAERKIKQLLGANNNNYLIPVGSGATGAIAKLCDVLGLYISPCLRIHINKLRNNIRAEDINKIINYFHHIKPIIFVGPYEHHSNYLIWKESLAEVIEIKLTQDMEFDYDDLIKKLKQYPNRVKMGSFSAASNITGVLTDVYKVAEIMHNHNGLVFFDFAASAPYIEINMNKNRKSYFDAIFLSPHKFIGGPGSSGLLVINKKLYSNLYPPTICGGGTVEFVSPYYYEFIKDVEVRENAGTPGILQLIKAALVLELKALIGYDKIIEIETRMLHKAFKELNNDEKIIIYGPKVVKKRISIISFNIKHKNKLLHHRFVSKLLNDLFGIQSRAGCACAGPYAHRLLGINKEKSKLLNSALKENEALRPGFVRINFHYLMSDEEVEFIIEAIKFISKYGYLFLTQYTVNTKTGEWTHNYLLDYNDRVTNFGLKECLEYIELKKENQNNINKTLEYRKYLDEAYHIAKILNKVNNLEYKKFHNIKHEFLRWFNFI